MKDYIKYFSEYLDFPADAAASLLEAYDLLSLNSEAFGEFCSWVRKYEEDIEFIHWETYDRMIDATAHIAGISGIDRRRIELLLYICLTKHLKEIYEKNGYPESMYKATVCDLKAKMNECHKLSGVWGTNERTWFAGFFKTDRFGIGRLQFELIEFGWDDYKDDKGHELHATSNVINIHIPSYPEKLSHDDVLAAYKLAADFYADRFETPYVPFLCSSWLLFKPANDNLPETSNIRKFMNDFDVFRWSSDRPHFGELWRIYYNEYNQDFTKLPEDTSVKRVYKNWILAGNTIGDGSGVLFVEKPGFGGPKWKGKKRMYSFYKDYDPEADARGDYL